MKQLASIQGQGRGQGPALSLPTSPREAQAGLAARADALTHYARAAAPGVTTRHRSGYVCDAGHRYRSNSYMPYYNHSNYHRTWHKHKLHEYIIAYARIIISHGGPGSDENGGSSCWLLRAVGDGELYKNTGARNPDRPALRGRMLRLSLRARGWGGSETPAPPRAAPQPPKGRRRSKAATGGGRGPGRQDRHGAGVPLPRQA